MAASERREKARGLSEDQESGNGINRSATNSSPSAPQAPGGGERALELADYCRSQAHRQAVRRLRFPLLSSRWAGSDADSGPVDAAGKQRRRCPALQRALHHAWHDDDLPRSHALERRLLQSGRAAPDRRARRCLPTFERLFLLDLPGGRPDPLSPDAVLAAWHFCPYCRGRPEQLAWVALSERSPALA